MDCWSSLSAENRLLVGSGVFPLIGDADLVVRVCRSGRVNLRLYAAGSVNSAVGGAVAAL